MPDDGKRRVTLELDAGLVAEAEKLGPDLSFTVQRALNRHMRPRQHLSDAEVAEYLRAANEWHEKHGLAGEEYLPI